MGVCTANRLGCTKESHTHENCFTIGLDWTGQELEELYRVCYLYLGVIYEPGDLREQLCLDVICFSTKYQIFTTGTLYKWFI